MIKQKQNLVIDLDGCLVDFNTGFAKLLKRISPTIKVDLLSDTFPPVWDWPQYYGYTQETIDQAWTEVRNSGEFWKSLHPYATAHADIQFLQQLQSKHDIYFATNRPGSTAKQESEWWLDRWGFEKPTVVVTGRKKEFCHSVDAYALVDDLPGNMFGLEAPTKPILFKRPYNYDSWDHYTTVNTIREALNAL